MKTLIPKEHFNFGDRVLVTLSEPEIKPFEATIVGLDLDRFGTLYYTVEEDDGSRSDDWNGSNFTKINNNTL